MLTGLELCGLFVDYYDYCVSAVWTFILTAPIHCRRSIGEQVIQCYIYPILIRWINKLIYILDGLRVNHFSTDFHFWVNYFFKVGWLASSRNAMVQHLQDEQNITFVDKCNAISFNSSVVLRNCSDLWNITRIRKILWITLQHIRRFYMVPKWITIEKIINIIINNLIIKFKVKKFCNSCPFSLITSISI